MDDLQLLVSIDIPKSVGNINGDLSKLESMVKKLQVEVELKGLDKLAKEISSFNKLESAIKDIGRALDKVKTDAKEMQSAFKKTGNDVGFKGISDELAKVSVESKGVIQDYSKLGQAIKQEMKEIGLAQESLTFKELRNSAGNLEGLTATFKATTGEVREFVSKANELGKLELINTKTTQSLERVKSDFQTLRTEIEKYRSLIGDTKANSLLDGMANGKSIEQTTSKLREYISVMHEATNVVQAMKQAEKAYDVGSISGKQYEELTNSLRTGKLAVQDFHNALKVAQSSQSSNNSAVKEEISLTKQRVQALNTLRTTLNSIGKDIPQSGAMNQVFEQGKNLARQLADGTNKTQAEVQKLLSEYRNLIPVLKDVSSASKKESLLGDIDKSIAKIDHVKAKLASLGADQKFDDTFVKGFTEINNAGDKTVKALQQDFQEIKRVANEAGKELAQAMKMEKFGQTVGDFDKFNALFKSGNTEGMRQYISQLAGMEAQTMKLKTVMNGAGEPIQQLAVGFKSSGQEMKSITYTMDEVTGRTGKLRQGMEELTFNANRNLSVWEQFKVAMSRFGVWSIAQEGIQATTRALREMMNEILETDKQLTDIKRVIEDSIDLSVLQDGAMNLATNLGNSFHDVLNAVGEIARAYGDFNEQQILSVANTATLMSNVSDISATDAINSLIGTMKAFNIEAQDSIRIVDSWNEVDNNFAISTEQISSAFEKSSATAKTFGVTMEENLGNITAIGGVTMETGQVIGNALKTIYSRITTLDGAKAVLKGVGVAITEIGEDGKATSRSVQDILEDLAGRWDQLSSAQKQNIGVQVAGRNQLSRFLALMNDWGTSQEAIKTAMNSTGGAMRENEAYLDSYEAKINKMKNVFSQLSLTIGETFIKGGLNVGIEALTGTMNVLEDMVNKIGVLGTAGALLSPLIIKFTGLGSAIVGLSGRVSLISGIGKVFSGIAHPVQTAQNAVEKFRMAMDKVADKAKTLNLTKAFKDANVNMSVEGFKRYQAGLDNIKRSSDTLAKGQSNLISTVKTSSGSFQVLGDKAKISSKNITFNSEAVKTASTNISAVKKATDVASTSMAGLGRAGQIASVGMRALGTAFKTVLISTGVGIAIAGVMMVIEKLINKYTEYQEKIKAQKEAQESLVESFRTSGDSLSSLVDKYDALYQKWGDFYEATNSGKLDPDLNPDAYEEYETVINRLSQTMPELIDYTDAQGQAHLKNADAMGKVVEEARKLSIEQAKLEKSQFEDKLKSNLSSLDETVEKYKKNAKAIKELETQLKSYQKTAKEGSSAKNQYAGNGLYSSEREQAEQNISGTQANIAKKNREQQESLEAVKSEVQSVIATLKDYGNILIEINGYSDKLGANTKAMIQNFAQSNSAIIDSIDIKDYGSDIDKYLDDVASASTRIKEANETMATSIASAMDAYVASSTKGVSSVRDIEQATSTAKAEFESFAKIVPQSMQSLDAVNNGTFQNLMSNSSELIKLQKEFTNGSASYSDVRTKLESMGLSTKDASQYMRNLATEAGNASIQSQLLESTTDELSTSMNDLKEASNETLKVFNEMAGISEDNVGALGSYIDVLDQAKTMYGDNARETEAYQSAIEGLSTMFGVSSDAVENNLEGYRTMSSVLDEVKTNMTDADGNARTLQQSIEATGGVASEALKLAQESGIGFNDALMITLGLMPSFAEMASKISSIDFSNPKDQMAGLVEAYMKGESTFESFSAKMRELDSNFDETAGVYDTVKLKFVDMADQLLETAEKTGDVGKAFSDMRGELESSLQSIGLPQNVIDMMLDQLESLTVDGINPFKQAVQELHEESGKPIEVSYKANTEEANAKIDETTKKVVDADGQEIDVVAGAETSNFDEGMGNVEQKVAENDGKVIDISADLNLSGNWSNNTEQLESVINYMKENEITSITIEGKAYGLDELESGLTRVKDGIDSAIEVADGMSNIDQVISDAQGNIVEIGNTIADKMQSIGTGLSTIGDQVGKVNQIKDEIANLLDPLSKLDTGLSDASTGINGALDKIFEKGQTVGSQLETFKTAVSDLGAGSEGSISNLGQLGDAIKVAGDNAGSANGNIGTLNSSLSGISGAIGDASGAVNNLIQSLASIGTAGVVSSLGVTLALQSIATQAQISSSSTSASMSVLASAVGRATVAVSMSSILATSAFGKIASKATESANITGNVWQSASGRVSAGVSGINSSLQSIISTMDRVRSGAHATVDALGRIGGAISSATSSMSGFSAIASGVIEAAGRVISKVNQASEAKSRLASSEVTELVGAMKEAVSQGQPHRYMEIAYQQGTLTALGDDFSSVASGAMEGVSGRLVASATKTEKEDPYTIDVWGTGNGRKYAGINKVLSQVEAKLKGINRESSKYRGTLDIIIKNEKSRLQLIKTELSQNEKRKTQIEAELKKLPAVSKQNEAQRKKYNALQKEYDDVIGNIKTLSTEVENLNNSINDNIQEQFESFIDEIVKKYETAIDKLQENVDKYDFEIEVLSYVDSDNISKQLDLLKKKQNSQLAIQSQYMNLQNSLQSQYNNAVKQYGSNDARTLYLKEQLTEATKNYRDATIDVLAVEKEIADIREDVAEKSIDKLKDYYEKMKDLALDAIKAEQDALEKAQEAKNKLYDKEIQKIKDVYSAKMDQMDKEDAEADYQEKMSDLTGTRDELQKQIAIAERDNSLAGKKRLADLQKQLAEQNKEIANAQKERQKELLKEQLQAEEEAQISAIEKQKELEEEELQNKLDGLDQQASDVEKKYDSILDDDEYWANLKDKIENGDLKEVTEAMQNMYGNLANMGDGAFDGLIDGFANFSEEAKKAIEDLSESIVKNLEFGDGVNLLDLLAQLKSGTNGYKETDGKGGNKQSSLGTPTWMTGNSGYSAGNILTSSGTAPDPSKGNGSVANGSKPVIGGTYVVQRDVGAYYTSDNAKARKNRLGTVKKGTYWIYNIYNGMINVTNKKGAMGSWINPADNKGGLDVNGNAIKGSQLNGSRSETSSSSGSISRFVPEGGSTYLRSLGVSKASGSADKLQAFDTGGYTGNWSGSDGKIAMLHKKELVLNEEQTRNILNSAKVLEKLKSLMPKLLDPSLDGLAKANAQAQVIQEGDINVNVEVDKFTGTKQERDNLISTINQSLADGFKRKGKKTK